MDTIAAWLSQIGLSQYAEVFQRNDIGPDLLASLTDQDLRDLGVQSLGHRKTLLRAIAEWGESEVVAPASALRSHAPSPASAPQSSAEGERRQLAVLFCDMVGFTELANRVDPEVLQRIIRVYEDACAVCITRYEGYVFQRMGDGIVAFFGYPLAHEGEAERAIHAGLSIIEALSKLDVPEVGHLQVRIGIATGSFDYKDLGEQTLKGIAHPTHALPVLALLRQQRFLAEHRQLRAGVEVRPRPGCAHRKASPGCGRTRASAGKRLNC